MREGRQFLFLGEGNHLCLAHNDFNVTNDLDEDRRIGEALRERKACFIVGDTNIRYICHEYSLLNLSNVPHQFHVVLSHPTSLPFAAIAHSWKMSKAGFSPCNTQAKVKGFTKNGENAMAATIERLGSQHDRGAFDCGKISLNDFLTRLVSQYEKRNLARTYVLVRSGEMKVLGYYTLASSTIEFDSLPEAHAKKLPQHPMPAVLLARLAVDTSCKGQGFGGELLRDCFQRCVLLADQIGIHSVKVDAIDDEAARFYEHFGFIRFSDQSDKLFIPISVIKGAITG